MALPTDPPSIWTTARGSLDLDRPVMVGILNVTPDSFSDGGRLPTLDAALARAEWLLAEGVGMLDVGGESTRPGRPEAVGAEEEIARVVPVVAAIVRRWPKALVSVDTFKADTARAALDVGAAVINDVSGFRLDAEMPSVVAASGAGVVLMHSRGDRADVAGAGHTEYGGDLVGTVITRIARGAGPGGRRGASAPSASSSILDSASRKPPSQNILLADQLGALRALGRPLLVGPSRKRFLGEITGRDLADRDRATAALCALTYARGARLFRIHDPAAVRDALAVAHALGAQP